MECEHGTVAIRLRIVAGGGKQYVRQCLDCGKATTNAIRKDIALKECGRKEAFPFDEELQESYRKKRAEHHAAQRRTEREEFFKWYSEYLKSPEWRRKRSLVMERAKGVCEGCMSRDATEVHHTTYEHVGEEFLFELVAICDICHKRAHEKRDQKAVSEF